MKTLRLMLTGLLLAAPLAAAHAQVAVGVAVGPTYVPNDDYAYYGPPPACEWGYYPYYPYACVPYGYYGPNYFYDGVFIGVGPWYGWGWRNYGWFHGWRGPNHGWHGPDHGWRGPDRGYVPPRAYPGGGAPGGRAYNGGGAAPRATAGAVSIALA